MAEIHIGLDASIVDFDESINITLSFTGTGYNFDEADIIALNDNTVTDKKTARDNLRKYLFPKNWNSKIGNEAEEDLPTSIAMYIFKEEGGVLTCDHLDKPILIDINKFEIEKEYKFSNEVFSIQSEEILEESFNLNRVISPIKIKNKDKEKLIISNTEIPNQVPNHSVFYNVARLSQDASPYNYINKFVLFGTVTPISEAHEKILSIKGEDKNKFEFLFLPISFKDNSKWFGEIIKDEIQHNFCKINYGGFKFKIADSLVLTGAKLITKLTPYPKQNIENSKLKLRYDEGGFSGTVKEIKIDNTESLTYDKTSENYSLVEIASAFLVKPEELESEIKLFESIHSLPFTGDFFLVNKENCIKFFYQSVINILIEPFYIHRSSETDNFFAKNNLNNHLIDTNDLRDFRKLNLFDKKLNEVNKFLEAEFENRIEKIEFIGDGAITEVNSSKIFNFLGVDAFSTLVVLYNNFSGYYNDDLELTYNNTVKLFNKFQDNDFIFKYLTILYCKDILNLDSYYQNLNFKVFNSKYFYDEYSKFFYLQPEINKFVINKDYYSIIDMFIYLPNFKIESLIDFLVPKDKEKEKVTITPLVRKVLNNKINEKNGLNKNNGLTKICQPVKIQLADLVLDEEEDLSNEIAGYVLVGQRSTVINDDAKYENWIHYNIADIQIEKDVKGNKLFEKITTILKPTFLPKVNGIAETSVYLSNEVNSLAIMESVSEDEDKKLYKIENKGYSKPKSKIKYINNEDQKPYSWYYGYHYNLAAFVVLNSGVLPPALRNKEGKLNIPELNLGNRKFNNAVDFHYLRRVPINAPRVNLVTGKQPGKNDIFYPLAKEMGKDFGFNETDPIFVMGEGYIDTLTFSIQKPTTDFWNWYSFTGKDALPILNGLPDDFDINLIEDNAVAEKFLVEIINTTKSGIVTSSNSRFTVLDYSHFVESKFNSTIGKTSKHKYDYNQEIEFSLKIDNLNPFNLKKGKAYKIRIYSLSNVNYFNPDNEDYRFSEAVKNDLDLKEYIKFLESDKSVEAQKIRNELNGFVVCSPFEFIVEVATILEQDQIKELQKNVWENLKFNQLEKDKEVYAYLKNKHPNLSYFSKAKLTHQVWHWNGRMDFIDKYFLDGEENLDVIKGLNPVKEKDQYQNSKGSKWEAWAFGNRSDHNAMSFYSNLKYDDKNPILFKDNRPSETKALYYRFGLKLYNRYRFMGGRYFLNNIEASIPITGIEHKWKSHIRKAIRQEKLPMPLVKFYLPLTNAIGQYSDTQKVAPIMIITHGNAFAECGIAQKLEIGVAKDEYNSNEYLQMGYDPILSGKALEGEGKREGLFKIFAPRSVVGFSYDLNAELPLIQNSAYIFDCPTELSSTTNEMSGWSMANIAVRNNVRTEFLEGANIDIASEWSAKEWVQFIPALKSFLPKEWLQNVGINGVSIDLEDLKLPLFDDHFEDHTERYLIFTNEVNDINGNPCEQFCDIRMYDDKAKPLLKINNSNTEDLLKIEFQGFLRMLIVRVKNKRTSNSENIDIWEDLFGNYANDVSSNVIKEIQNDASVAMPMITERVKIIINNKK